MLRLQYERVRRRKSQWNVAVLANVNQTPLSRWERGVATPSDEELRRLAAVFGVDPPSALLEEVEAVEHA